MKKIFAALLLVSVMFDFAYAQVERKEIDIEAYGEHVQVFNVGKEGLVFFYPLEKGFKRDKNQKYRLQGFDNSLEQSWSQEFSLSAKFELIKFEKEGETLSLLFKTKKGKTSYDFRQIDLLDGALMNKLNIKDKLLSENVKDFDVVSTNLILYAQEKDYPPSYSIDLYTGRIREVVKEDSHQAKYNFRVGGGVNYNRSGFWDFINETDKKFGSQLKLVTYDGAGREQKRVSQVLAPNKVMNFAEIDSEESGNHFVLGTFGKGGSSSMQSRSGGLDNFSVGISYNSQTGKMMPTFTPDFNKKSNKKLEEKKDLDYGLIYGKIDKDGSNPIY
jgi:hypothetical protein